MEADIGIFFFSFFSLIKSEEISPFYSLQWFRTQQDTTTLGKKMEDEKTKHAKQNKKIRTQKQKTEEKIKMKKGM